MGTALTRRRRVGGLALAMAIGAVAWAVVAAVLFL